jgi:Short C-terminal domain
MGGRAMGLLWMGIAVAAFLGTTSETLPAAVFFPALLLFGFGAFQFMKSNSEALAEADRRTQEMLRPVIREDHAAANAAERRAMRRGEALNALNGQGDVARVRPGRTAVRAAAAGALAADAAPTSTERDAIELDLEVEAEDPTLVITTDVSFPLEVQRGDALADQLRKLNHLLTQGVLTEAEYAIAKAKLLG